MLLAIASLRLALAFLAGHSADVTRLSADRYRVGSVVVTTVACTTTAREGDGERARVARSSTGKPFLAFRSGDGEADGECTVRSVDAMR